ncbi:MAG: GNAT family N-acetyltransferase [Chloroflexi bacterium]|nr:GNAT family N-acetyltransferase [Chloroflexota bacterium]
MSRDAHATTDEHREALARPPATLRPHDVTLRGPRLVLRPMKEDDWAPLLAWNNDPEVLAWAEGDEIESRTLDEVQRIYRAISVNAHCFLMELDGEPIGECWLQRMNLERLVARHQDEDVRRIDIAIGLPALWGQGLGREAVGLLLDFGFRREGVDVIYACVDADNARSRRMFASLGFAVEAGVDAGGFQGDAELDLMLSRAKYDAVRFND